MVRGTLASEKKNTVYPGGMGVSCSWLYLGKGWSNAVPTFVIMVVAKVRERLAVSKQAVQKLDGERFNLRKLKDLEVKKQ